MFSLTSIKQLPGSFLLSSLPEDTAFEAGVRVQIHSQAEPPFVHELGFGVAPGFQTFVATQEQRVGVADFSFTYPAHLREVKKSKKTDSVNE